MRSSIVVARKLSSALSISTLTARSLSLLSNAIAEGAPTRSRRGSPRLSAKAFSTFLRPEIFPGGLAGSHASSTVPRIFSSGRGQFREQLQRRAKPRRTISRRCAIPLTRYFERYDASFAEDITGLTSTTKLSPVTICHSLDSWCSRHRQAR